jgi:hypothetical protein
MSFFQTLKAKLTGKKKDKKTKQKEQTVEAASKTEGGGDVHILPVPGVSVVPSLRLTKLCLVWPMPTLQLVTDNMASYRIRMNPHKLEAVSTRTQQCVPSTSKSLYSFADTSLS